MPMTKRLTQRRRNKGVVKPLWQAVKTRGYCTRVEWTVDAEVAGMVSSMPPAGRHARDEEASTHERDAYSI